MTDTHDRGLHNKMGGPGRKEIYYVSGGRVSSLEEGSRCKLDRVIIRQSTFTLSSKATVTKATKFNLRLLFFVLPTPVASGIYIYV